MLHWVQNNVTYKHYRINDQQFIESQNVLFVKISPSILTWPLSISKTLDKILSENRLRLTLHSLLQHG